MHSTAPILYGKCSTIVSSTDLSTQISSNNITSNSNPTDDLKTHFIAPEGVYKQMTIGEFNRPPKLTNTQTTCSNSNTPVRVSFLKVNVDNVHKNDPKYKNCNFVERICLNIGRGLYVYDYCNAQNGFDLSKPIDKRFYKGTFPTCHDFNTETATLHSSSLIIGFTAGQIQLFDPYQKDGQSKLFNEDRNIEKTAVTFVRWIPGQTSFFAVSHVSGNLYIYNEDYNWFSTPPNYQILKQAEGFTIFSCKSKTPRNPVLKWSIGHGAINQFEFSNNEAKFLATVSQDGFLRIFNYKTMELLSYMKSYFGGLLTLAWSPDFALIATGGEDDMLTVYSVKEKRVLCRGQGHKSWVSQVAFDSFLFSASEVINVQENYNLENNDGNTTSIKKEFLLKQNNVPITKVVQNFSIEENDNLVVENKHNQNHLKSLDSIEMSYTSNKNSNNVVNCAKNSTHMWSNANDKSLILNDKETITISLNKKKIESSVTRPCYRIGSVGFDTQLCLWDLPDDVFNCKTNSNSVNFGQKKDVNFGASCSTVIQNEKENGNTTLISIGITKKNENTLTNQLQNNASSVVPSSSDTLSERNVEESISENANKLHSFHIKDVKDKLKKLHKQGLLFGSRFNERWSKSNGNSSKVNGYLNENLNDGIKSLKRSTIIQNSYDCSTRIFGTAQCPFMEDISVIEPLVCKKIAHERLTALYFRDDCLMTACQEGIVLTWARPETLSYLKNGKTVV